jgi:hypothetical protein
MHLMKKQKKLWLKESHAGATGSGEGGAGGDSDDESAAAEDPELQGKNPIQRRIAAEAKAAHAAKVAHDMGSSLIGQARASTREAQEEADAGGSLVRARLAPKEGHVKRSRVFKGNL